MRRKGLDSLRGCGACLPWQFTTFANENFSSLATASESSLSFTPRTRTVSALPARFRRFDCYRIEPDSAGAGWHRGGPGVTRRWSFPYNDVVLSSLGDGEKFGPWGWAGGRDARPNRFVCAPGTIEELNVGMFRTNLEIRAGRMLDCFQPGGGGYGPRVGRTTS